ncbi:MAG: hypothetical protein CME64_16200 [Halobacteriovoraceae bacterium]|nr:hypothetical protein [Halobacteriovoraceae bacterium]
MKSFLIGSLPFESVEEAIDYVFSFDVPTLPNLPQLYEDEFMLNQAFECLEGYSFTGAAVKVDSQKKSSLLSFSAKSEFFERLGSTYKWQACGPLTLLSALDHHTKSEEILDNYLDQLIATQKEFNILSSDPFLFLLDEPVLAFCEDNIDVLKRFISKLKSSSTLKLGRVGIHACSKVSLSTLQTLGLELYALDPSLYSSDEMKELQKSLGSRLVYTPVSSKGAEINYRPHEEEYSAPSCGGALSSKMEMDNIKKILRS